MTTSKVERRVTDMEALRMERGWPTPNHMRHAADGLDMLAFPRYGDILRWVADACDADPAPTLEDHERRLGNLGQQMFTLSEQVRRLMPVPARVWELDSLGSQKPPEAQSIVCPECGGSGRVFNDDDEGERDFCQICGGSGRYTPEPPTGEPR